MKKYIQYCLLFLLTAISIVYFYIHRAQLTVLAQIELMELVKLTLVLFLFFVLTGYTFRLLVDLVGIKLSLLETVGLSILTNFGNYLGPARPGAVLKAAYLKSTKGLSYSYFGAVLAANSFVVFFMTGLVGLVLLVSLYLAGETVPALLGGACCVLIAVSFIPYGVKKIKIIPIAKLPSVIKKSLEGFSIIREQRVKLLYVCISFLGQFALSAILYIVAFAALEEPITFLSAMIIGVFTSVANFFTITPNNLGIQEIVSAYLLVITGYDFTTGVIGVSLIRIIHMLITFSLAPVFSYLLLKSTREEFEETAGR